MFSDLLQTRLESLQMKIPGPVWFSMLMFFLKLLFGKMNHEDFKVSKIVLLQSPPQWWWAFSPADILCLSTMAAVHSAPDSVGWLSKWNRATSTCLLWKRPTHQSRSGSKIVIWPSDQFGWHFKSFCGSSRQDCTQLLTGNVPKGLNWLLIAVVLT